MRSAESEAPEPVPAEDLTRPATIGEVDENRERLIDHFERKQARASRRVIGVILLAMLAVLIISWLLLNGSTHKVNASAQAALSKAVQDQSATNEELRGDQSATNATAAKHDSILLGCYTVDDSTGDTTFTPGLVAMAESTKAKQGRLEATQIAQEHQLGMFREQIDGLAGGLQQLYPEVQEAKEARVAALRWRDSILGRISILEKRPAEQVVPREVARGSSNPGNRTAASGSGRVPTPVAPPVETVQVATTSSTALTVAVTVRNALANNARVTYKSWNKVLGPNGLVVLNLPPGEIILLVISNLNKSGEGWVIPVNAATQRNVIISPR